MNLSLYRYVGRFPRAHKPVLGNQILQISNHILSKTMEASYLKDGGKEEALRGVDVELKKLTLFLRFAKDLSFLSYKGYEYLVKEMVEMGKMVGGWQKWQALQDQPGEKSKKTVVYTMESPVIRKYLDIKSSHPQQVVALKVGAFYKLFFDDARYFQKRYRFMLRNLADPSSPVKIESCGFPTGSAEKYRREVDHLMLIDYVQPEKG